MDVFVMKDTLDSTVKTAVILNVKHASKTIMTSVSLVTEETRVNAVIAVLETINRQIVKYACPNTLVPTASIIALMVR